MTTKPLYFYHLAPKGIKGKGLYSLQYLYDHKMYDLFDKYTDKYRYRICYLWGYSNKKPYELTREEVIKYIKKFRDDDQLDEIYFFRFPPYYELGDHMKQILENKDIYRIDINDPHTKTYIKDIYWGTDGSQKDNIELDREYYVNVDQNDYFRRYNDKSQMNFASLNHISIKFKDGYCPFHLLTKVKTSSKMINENFIVSKNNIKYNLDKWGTKNHNILYITGLSGAGKSTLTDKLSKENPDAIIITLDFFFMSLLSKERYEKYKNRLDHITSDYFNKYHNKVGMFSNIPRTVKWEDIENSGKEIRKFINWIKNNYDDKIIIEGTQLFVYYDGNEFKNEPLIIIGTSMLKAFMRRAKRDMNGHTNYEKVKILFKRFNDIGWYIGREKQLSTFIKNIDMYLDNSKSIQEGIQIKEEEGQEEICKILNQIPYNRIYLTSDLHFHKLEQSQYDNKVKESRKKIKEAISKQNKIVHDDDVYIVLGDIAHRRNQSEFLDLIKEEYNQMKGIKILVKGNHDTLNNEFYHECGFDIVVNMFTWKNYVFTHEPIPVDGDRINIHGHIHEEKTYINMGWKNHINVFCEYYNMYPISLENALKKYDNGFYTGRTIYDPSYPYYNQMDIVKDRLVKLECSGLDYKQELEMAIIHNNKLEVDNIIKSYHEGTITKLELLDKLKDIEELPKLIINKNDNNNHQDDNDKPTLDYDTEPIVDKPDIKSHTESETLRIETLNKVKNIGDLPNDVNQIPHHNNYQDDNDKPTLDHDTEPIVDKPDTKSHIKSATETVMNRTLIATLKDAIYDDELINIEKAVSSIPFFSPEEMEDMGVYGEHNFYKVKIDNTNNKKWFNDYKLFTKGFLTEDFIKEQGKWINELNKLYMDYSKIKASGNKDMINKRKQSILELGWNPEIDFNEKTRKIVFKNNISKYKDKYKDTCIDVSFLKEESFEILREGSSKKELYPVFILITYTKTAFGKIIRKVTHGKYTHSAISLDSSMNNLFSFNASESNQSGFSVESLKRYNHDDDCIMCVYCFFVKKDKLLHIKTKLDWFLLNKKSSHYGYLNCITLVMNKVVELNNTMICSQFVDFLIKDIGVDLTHKSSALVTPNDYTKIDDPNVYKVYEGPINEYDYKKVDKIVNKLKKTSKPIVEAYLPIIQEAKSIPIQFDKDGNLLIKNYKNNKLDINEEYWKSHKLLLNYEKNVKANEEAIKYELAKLWFLNIILESKIYRNKDEDDINDYQVIRARVLNDFNKYIKMIPGFNFTEYYNNSPFSDATIKIDNHTIKYSIKYLRDILKLSIK